MVKVRYAHVLNLVVSASRDRTIQFWNPNADASVQKFVGHELVVTAIDFNPGRFPWQTSRIRKNEFSFLENTVMVSGSRDNKVIFWDVKTGQILRSIMIGRNLVGGNFLKHENKD